MRAQSKSESKVLDRSYVELSLEGKAGKLTRKEAIATVAQELGVPAERVGIIRLDGQAGTTTVVARFYVYGSQEAKKKVHPRHLEERLLTREERGKLKQERKKAAAPQAEAKK